MVNGGKFSLTAVDSKKLSKLFGISFLKYSIDELLT